MPKFILPLKSQQKAEHVALIVALIAAAASLLGVLYNQYGAGLLEERKWQQAQQDSLQAIVVDFAKEITSAHQRAEFLVWRANHASETILPKDFDDFDREARISLPRIFGLRVLLIAKREETYASLDKAVNDFYASDECIGLAGVAFRKNKADGIRNLADCKTKVRQTTDAMFPSFANAMRTTSMPAPMLQ